MNKFTKVAATIALSALMFTGCGIDKKKNAVIMVNDTPITKQQYEKQYDNAVSQPMFQQNGVDLKKDRDSFIALMIKQRIVDELIVKALLDSEIKKQNIKIGKDDMDKELKNIIDRVGSKEKFNKILQENKISNDQFKKDLEEELKIKKLVDGLSVVNITDADAEKYYKENPDQFKYPDKVRASHILIAFNPVAESEEIAKDKNLTKEQIAQKLNEKKQAKKQKATELLAKVKQDPSSFEKIAKENSEDPGSAQKGGDLGYFAKEDMVETFSNAAFNAKPSTITEVIESPYGYHIIMVKDRMAAGTEPFEKVKNDIKTYLENKQKIEVFQNLIGKLKNEAKIEYVDPSFNTENIQKEIKEKIGKDKQQQVPDTEKPVVKKN